MKRFIILAMLATTLIGTKPTITYADTQQQVCEYKEVKEDCKANKDNKHNSLKKAINTRNKYKQTYLKYKNKVKKAKKVYKRKHNKHNKALLKKARKSYNKWNSKYKKAISAVKTRKEQYNKAYDKYQKAVTNYNKSLEAYTIHKDSLTTLDAQHTNYFKLHHSEYTQEEIEQFLTNIFNTVCTYNGVDDISISLVFTEETQVCIFGEIELISQTSAIVYTNPKCLDTYNREYLSAFTSICNSANAIVSGNICKNWEMLHEAHRSIGLQTQEFYNIPTRCNNN